jgi:hypothetical protein
LVFVVLPQRLARLDRQAATGNVMQLFAGLIQAYDRALWVIGALIHI